MERAGGEGAEEEGEGKVKDYDHRSENSQCLAEAGEDAFNNHLPQQVSVFVRLYK
jgi:hypothetical protein